MNRPHPLGLVAHPEWARVEDRYNELWCNDALRQMRCEEAPAPRPLPVWLVRTVGIIASLAACGGYVGLFWAFFL